MGDSTHRVFLPTHPRLWDRFWRRAGVPSRETFPRIRVCGGKPELIFNPDLPGIDGSSQASKLGLRTLGVATWCNPVWMQGRRNGESALVARCNPPRRTLACLVLPSLLRHSSAQGPATASSPGSAHITDCRRRFGTTLKARASAVNGRPDATPSGAFFRSGQTDLRSPASMIHLSFSCLPRHVERLTSKVLRGESAACRQAVPERFRARYTEQARKSCATFMSVE